MEPRSTIAVFRSYAGACAVPAFAAVVLLIAAAGVSAMAGADRAGEAALVGVVIAAPVCASLACFLRSRAAVGRRSPWATLCVSLLCAGAANAVAGESTLDPMVVPSPAVAALWLLSYATGLRAFALLVILRAGRLRWTTWLDGLLGALVVQAVVTLVLLMPADVDVNASSASALVFPFADLLLVGLFIAATAQGGWRVAGWTPFIVGTVLVLIADCAFAARALGADQGAYELAVLGWPLAHLCFGYGAWARPGTPEPFPSGRPAVPVALGAIAAATLGAAALTDAPVAGVSAGLALLGVAGVLARFGVTLAENERMTRVAQAQALTDALTNLPNRRRFEHDLASAVATATAASPAVVALFDLDGFKRYNDTLGHGAGDDLLAAIGARLGDAVRPCGTAYRLGGDEFCLLIPDRGSDADRRVTEAAAALSPDITGFPVTASYGAALVPIEASDAETALALADQRMYRHKAAKAQPRERGAVDIAAVSE